MQGYKTSHRKPINYAVVDDDKLEISAPTMKIYNSNYHGIIMDKMRCNQPDKDFSNFLKHVLHKTHVISEEETVFFGKFRQFLEEEFALYYKNTQAKLVDSDEDLYDKFLVLKLNEDVSSSKLDNLLSEAISKGANYARKNGFLDYFERILISVTR